MFLVFLFCIAWSKHSLFFLLIKFFCARKLSITHPLEILLFILGFARPWFQLSQLCSCVLWKPTIPWTVSMGIYPIRELDFISFPQNWQKWKSWERTSASFQCITQNILPLLFIYWACIVCVLFCKSSYLWEETILSWSL